MRVCVCVCVCVCVRAFLSLRYSLFICASVNSEHMLIVTLTHTPGVTSVLTDAYRGITITP